MEQVRRAPWLALLGLVGLVGLILLGTYQARHVARFTPIAAVSAPAGWESNANFHAAPVSSDPLEFPSAIRGFAGLKLWRSYTPERGMLAGQLISAPFSPGDYLAIPYMGFPGEQPGTAIVVRCDATGEELPVSSLRTNTQWALAFLDMRGFCAGQVRLIARNATNRFLVGVGTPFTANRFAWIAHTQAGPRLLALLGGWLIFTLLGHACIVVLRRLAPALDPLPAAMIGLGVLAMVQFTFFTWGPLPGRFAVWAMATGALLLALVRLWLRPQSVGADLRAAAGPLLAWLGVAVAGVSLVTAADSGGGSWAVNGLFTPARWSTDSQLPMLFTEALMSETVRADFRFASPWQVTDRGPLMTALLAFPRVLLTGLGRHWGSTFFVHLYMGASILLLASWVLLVPWLATKMELRRPGWMLASLIASPFLIFNTLYTWPKLVGAVYVVLCVALLFAPGARAQLRRRGVLPAVALAAGLAYLAHASNAFALVPIALFALPAIWQAGPAPILLGSLAFLVVMLPWLWWQAAIQPGATALLRFALAGEFGLYRRADPIWPDVVASYQRMGFGGWISAKLDGLRLLAGFPRDWMAMAEVGRSAPRQPALGSWRVADFFSLARGLNASLLVIPLLIVARLRRTPLSQAGLGPVFIGVGLGGIALNLLVTLPESWLHHQPYGSVLLLQLGLLLLADRLPRGIAWVVPVVGAAYAAVVWVLPPLIWADRLVWTGALGMMAGLALAASGARPANLVFPLGADQSWVVRLARPPAWLTYLSWLALGATCLHAAYVLLAWLNEPLLDQHSFRQTQTALSVYWITQGGPWFGYETPVLGAPWAIPFEAPVYHLPVALLAWLGLPLEAAGRLVAFGFLLAGAWPLRLLWRDLALPPLGYPMACALILASPLYLFWGRTFLIETCAWFFALLWLAFFVRFLVTERAAPAVMAVLAGCLATLAKATSFPAFALLGGLLALPHGWRWLREGMSLRLVRLAGWGGVALLLPFVVGLAWVGFSDGVKSLNLLGGRLTSAALGGWNYGSMNQRVSAGLWDGVIHRRILPDIFGGAGAIALIALLGAAFCRRSLLAVALGVLCFLVPILVFTNLHLVHNYYQVANGAFLIVAVAIALATLARYRLGAPIAGLLLLALLGSQVAQFQSKNLRWISAGAQGTPAQRAGVMLRDLIPPDGALIVLGEDWSSTVPYYARRRTLNLPSWASPAQVEAVLSDPQAHLTGAHYAGVLDCTRGGFPYRQAIRPRVEAFLEGRRLIAEEGHCRFLSPEQRREGG